MIKDLPQWVIDYNNKGHQSSAGKALRATFESIDLMKAQNQELTTRLYNLVNQIEIALHKDPDFAIGFYPGSGLMAAYEEARETLKKVIG